MRTINQRAEEIVAQRYSNGERIDIHEELKKTIKFLIEQDKICFENKQKQIQQYEVYSSLSCDLYEHDECFSCKNCNKKFPLFQRDVEDKFRRFRFLSKNELRIIHRNLYGICKYSGIELEKV